MTLIKILGPNRESIHGGHWTWQVGEWTPETHPVLCVSGWHLIRPWNLGEWWVPDCTVWEAEGRGLHDAAGPKTAWAQARILRQLRTPTLPELVGWAADCAERALPHVPPPEGRPALAIVAAKAWAACPCATHAASAAYAARAARAAYASAAVADAGAYASAAVADAGAYAARAALAVATACAFAPANAYVADAGAYAARAAAANAYDAYASAYANANAYAASAAVAGAGAYAASAAVADATVAVARAAVAGAYAARDAASAGERQWQDAHMMALLEPK